MEVVGQQQPLPPRLPVVGGSQEDHHHHHPMPSKSPTGGRNSFFIQDILSPEFGNRQLKEQYYAYLHYYYTLHMHNMMVMRSQHQIQSRLQQKEKLEHLESSSTSAPSAIRFDQKVKHAEGGGVLVRPIPRNFTANNILHSSSSTASSFPATEVPGVPKPVVAAGFSGGGVNRIPSCFPLENNGSSGIDAMVIGHGNNTGVDSLERFLSNKDKHLQLEKDHHNRQKLTGGNGGLNKLKDSFGHGLLQNKSDKRDRDLHRTEGSKISRESGRKICVTSEEDDGDAEQQHEETGSATQPAEGDDKSMWPAWVYCTRYSDRPSSGPRSRKIKRKSSEESTTVACGMMEKRPRIAFTNEQLARLKREFDENRYLTEERRAKLAGELDLTESQVKIWFQNKRAKLKKSCGARNPLALQLMQQGLYNHATIPLDDED